MHFRRAIVLLLTVATCLVAARIGRVVAEEGRRTWTDSTGKHEVVARFVELDGTTVVLRRNDGKTVRVPLARLSDADQRAANEAAARIRTASRVVASQDAEVGETSSDWPSWRGPNRDGISRETGLLKSWPADGPQELWRTNGFGGGFSSLTIADGRLFTMGNAGGTKLIAADINRGQVLWRAQVGGGSAPNCTPTVDSNLVFGLSHGGDLLCANVKTGAEVWRKNFPADFGGKMMSGWGYSESPLVDGDKLIVTPGSQSAMIAALDKRTGAVLWRSAMPRNVGSAGKDGAGYSSVVISNAAGVKQYVQLVGRGVISVDANTGQLLWGYNRIANGTANVPTPLVKGDYVFASSGYGDGGSALLKVTRSRGGNISPQEVYYKRNNELQNHHGGMILIGDHVYMGHGHNNGFPVCFDLLTGRDMWRPGRGPGGGSAAVVSADGHLYFRYESGVMALIEATPERYNLKGSFKIAIKNGQSWSHPVVSDGRLYLRDQNEMICYDVRM